MASSTLEKKNSFDPANTFPAVKDGRINVVKFLAASTDLIVLVEQLGTGFAPIKYDMQGNIDKIKKNYRYDDNSCLLELMLEETASGNQVAAEGILWLNRAILFFELVFVEILKHLKDNNTNVNMKKIFTTAYEGSIKKYHNWVTQQLFTFICKMSPTLPQALTSLGAYKDISAFTINMETYIISQHLIRSKIDDFFKRQNLFT